MVALGIIKRVKNGVRTIWDLPLASCPAIQGCYTQGNTIDEAIENIKDAVNLHIEARKSLGEPVPVEVVVEEVGS